ncbi:MAG: DUF998 domain-containing protein [Ignisphaera sp.]|nr:DUF998 domain-containing protein [Ignisphaera sp.]MDW8084848.1 DUF998 domain-containing protein [Ignisphaera sp.]
MAANSTLCKSLVLASLTLPLLLILISIILSSWFNIYRNALSDLGHATRSSVAPIFNLGLSLGGVLVVVVGANYLTRVSRILGIVAAASGYSLILVAVFDEVYGVLHFWVSVLFFVLLATLLCIYIAVSRGFIERVAAISTLLVAVISWILHLEAGIPPGAAIPELISIAAVAPFYIDAAFRRACRE